MTALVPFNDLQQMGVALAKSGLFGMKSPEQAIALMLVAQAEGQHPATIAQDYDIIQGKATRKTHSVMARFQAAGGSVNWHSLTAETADATFSHPQGGSLRMVWTFEQARKAGLTNKDNWKNYPRAMLRARCIAEGVRAVYPAAIGGMLVAEEAQDMQPQHQASRHMGAADVVQEDAPVDLIATAEEAARQGMAAYQLFWAAAGAPNRKLLASRHDTFKAMADAADSTPALPPADVVEEPGSAE
jgi:hypothetical protein